MKITVEIEGCLTCRHVKSNVAPGQMQPRYTCEHPSNFRPFSSRILAPGHPDEPLSLIIARVSETIPNWCPLKNGEAY